MEPLPTNEESSENDDPMEHTNEDPNENEIIDIPKDGLKVGLEFPNEEVAVSSLLNWGRKALCPLMKARRAKTAAETNGESRGRRTFQCPNGKQRQIKSEQRPKQHVKYTRCPVAININEQEDGTFVITKAVLEHSGNFPI